MIHPPLFIHAHPPPAPLPFDLAGAAAMVTLLVLFLSAATADRTGRVGIAVLAVASVVWLLVNGPMEGSVLVKLSDTHGITAADLLGVTGLAVAAWRYSLWRRSRFRR